MAFKVGLSDGRELECGDEVQYQFMEGGVLGITTSSQRRYLAAGHWVEVVANETHTPWHPR